MQNKIKISSYILGIFLIILVGWFLFWHINKPQEETVVETKNNITTHIPPTTIVPAAVTDTNDAPKVVPAAVPIFMYHYIRDYTDANDPIGENLSVSPKKFEAQIAWLKSHNYQTVFPMFFKNPEALSAKPIILTFDDGYQDAFDNAFPILQKYDLRGMFYLIVNKVNTPGYLTWDEILTMQRAGMVFGSHTLTHPNLQNMSPSDLQKELGGSENILEQKLGTKITDFCYPSGKYDAAAQSELSKDGYQTAVTTAPGLANMQDNPLLLKRWRIMENTNIASLLEK